MIQRTERLGLSSALSIQVSLPTTRVTEICCLRRSMVLRRVALFEYTADNAPIDCLRTARITRIAIELDILSLQGTDIAIRGPRLAVVAMDEQALAVADYVTAVSSEVALHASDFGNLSDTSVRHIRCDVCCIRGIHNAIPPKKHC